MVGNLATWLIDGGLANGAGPRTALREGGRAWTFDELADNVARTSSALRGLRLQRGERVLILMRDTLEAAAAILGTIHAGAIAVPISELAAKKAPEPTPAKPKQTLTLPTATQAPG